MLRGAVFAFSLVLAYGSICSSFAADTQQAEKLWRIGFIGNNPPITPEIEHNWEAFRQALQERGYVEGRNLVIERRFMEGNPEKAPGFAAELVGLKVDLIVAVSNRPVQAARAATSTIPIVMVSAGDAVGVGLVASLARPGGNITGVLDSTTDLTPKRFELLKAALPRASRVAYIRCLKCNAGVAPATLAAYRDDLAVTAQNLGMTLVKVDLSSPQGLNDATTAILRERPDALFLAANPVNAAMRKELADFAMRERLPMFTFLREGIVGSLMAYGTSSADLFRKGADYVDKILKGANPGDLPIEQPTKFELIINLKTAKALNITIPQWLLLRADEVIQ